jgi:cytochrome c-type biogenesis protein CcmH
MVRGMVDGLASRLESSPDDPEGWIMLMRSHIVLNEQDKARAALERATKALADSPEKMKQIADAAKVMGLSASSE